MNDQTDSSSKEDIIVNNDEAEAGSEGLSVFFDELNIRPESIISVYKDKLAELGLNDVVELRREASMSFLMDRVGIQPQHVNRIMRKLFAIEPEAMEYAPRTHRTSRSIPPLLLDTSFLSKENVVILRQIGHGASGRVFKALFVPTLTLIAIKYVEIKGAIEQRIVAQELKSHYQVALRDHIGGDIGHESLEAGRTAPKTGAAHSPYLVGFYGVVSPS